MSGIIPVFVDTGAWYARVVRTDENHDEVSRWLRDHRLPLLTTDYVVDETLTLLKARGQARIALALGNELFGGSLATVYRLTEPDIHSAWQVFKHFTDKEWSFTDCTSKIVMENLGLTRAIALDHHFHQFGRFTIVP